MIALSSGLKSRTSSFTSVTLLSATKRATTWALLRPLRTSDQSVPLREKTAEALTVKVYARKTVHIKSVSKNAHEKTVEVL